MGKIVRHEFIGNQYFFLFLCLSGIFIPLAILYLMGATVTVEENIEDPTKFLMEYRAGKHRV